MSLLDRFILTPFRDGSPSLALFLFSATLLVVCLGIKAHMRAVQLSFLQHMPLNLIERDHPHLPSPRTIVVIAFCSVTLLLVALQMLKGVFPFDDVNQGLNIVSVFLLLATVGILAELKWKEAGGHVSAGIIGTAIAFLLQIVLANTISLAYPLKLFLFVLLLPSFLLGGQVFLGTAKRSALLTLVLTVALWTGLFLLAR